MVFRRYSIIAGYAALYLLASTGVQARALCADRPGLGTPPCTVEPGRVILETGLADWTHDSEATARTDTVEAGQFQLRFGLTERLEAQLGWTVFGAERVRDTLTGAAERQSGTGDVTLALRHNMRNPDGEGFSLAVMPRVTLPVGGSAIGAGDWSAALLLPVGVALGERLSLMLTPEIAAAVDEDRRGRHLAYGGVAGFDIAIAGAVSTTIEAAALRDDDPEGHETQALAGLSVGWQPSDDMQLDLGMNLGLNHHSPDREITIGVTRRF